MGEQPADLTVEPPPVAALAGGADDAAHQASVTNPTVLIAASDVDVAEAELRGSRANYYPRLDAELSASAADDVNGVQGQDRWRLGAAGDALQPFSWRRRHRARARSVPSGQPVPGELERARRRASEEARVSFNALETARDRSVALRAEAEAQRRTRDAYAGQFELGLRALLDVLDAENQLFTARVALTTAEYTERFAVYRNLAVVGTLLDTLDITRPREVISIYRAPDDVQTPEACATKSSSCASRARSRAPCAGPPPASPRRTRWTPPGGALSHRPVLT